jgi:hypothetical protein
MPKGKLASEALPKGSPEDGPETPDGVSNQYLTGPMQRMRETSDQIQQGRG